MKNSKTTHIGKKRKKRRRRRRRFLIFLILFILIFSYLKPLNLTYSEDPSIEVMEGEVSSKITNDSDIDYILSSIDTEESRRILGAKSSLPRNLYILAANEPESIPFISNYLNRERDSSRRYSFSTLNRSVPLYIQWDSRWGYKELGNSIFALSGCGPTSMAMVISGMTKNPLITPDSLINEAEGYMGESGISWEFFPYIADKYALKAETIPLSRSEINSELKKGHPIIVSVSPGDFTQHGHIMVISGLDEADNYIINDPNSINNSKKRWSYDRLSPQIKNLWSISKKLL